MSLISKVMPSFQGVAAGQSATAMLPIGLSYHELLMTYAGITLAQMDEIRVVANGKVIQRYASGTQLDTKNQFEGRAAAAGVLTIPVGDRYGLKARGGIEFSKLGTGMLDDPRPITTLSIEIDINAAAVAPVLSMIAEQSDPSYSGIIKLVDQYTYAPSAVGEYAIADLPKGKIFNQMFFQHANVTDVEIRRNGYTVFERSAAENNVIQNDGVRVTQESNFVVDFTEKGFGAEGLVTQGVQDLRILLTMSGAASVPLMLESMGPVTD
ncbi:MAG: hypothetical protein COB30_015340 [Ectothiorhodospiraceae bacterium]|nr:hypothetical protein [Ectothiorhodospiraceae bacterium]